MNGRFTTPRWEWRTFGSRFAALDAALPAERHVVHDLYLLCEHSGANVTVRGQELRVKTLDRVEDGLERWSLTCAAPFPLAANDIAKVFAVLGVAPPPLDGGPYSPVRFATDVVGAVDGLRVISVTKIQRRAVIAGCLAERATVMVGNRTFESAGVEAVEAARLRTVLHAYGLTRHDPVNYVEFLKQFIGWGPLPRPQPGAEEYPGARRIPAAGH